MNPILLEVASEEPSPVFDPPSPEPVLGESGAEPGESDGEAAAIAQKYNDLDIRVHFVTF